LARTELASGVAFGDRGAAVTAMAEGAGRAGLQLHAAGRPDGILPLGGSGGSSIATRAMRALPVGVPKLMVSTVASGDTRPYVGAVDVTMMYSVVDIAGVNRVSARIMANAAAAIAGMAGAQVPPLEEKPLVAATMFGVTTPCVTRARERLEELGYEVLVFHATGAGGQSMEALVRGGFLADGPDGALRPAEGRLDDRRRRPAVLRRRRRRGAAGGTARDARRTRRAARGRHGHQRPRVRDGDGGPPARVDPRMTRSEALARLR